MMWFKGGRGKVTIPNTKLSEVQQLHPENLQRESSILQESVSVLPGPLELIIARATYVGVEASPSPRTANRLDPRLWLDL